MQSTRFLAVNPSFATYVGRKLGSGRTAWFNFFLKPFAASSFAEFWRRWNPVYGYFLLYYVYRPLSQLMPRPAAALITFAACGLFLHDLPAWLLMRRMLPPGATIAFILFGLGALIGKALRMDLSGLPVTGRVAANVGYLIACAAAMLPIVLGMAGVA